MVLSHKRRTRLLSSFPYAYSGFFSITSGIILTTSILYIMFLPGIALGQEWIQYNNLDFMFNYPAFLRVYEVPYGVQLFLESEIGSEKPSFGYVATAWPYNGPSRNLNELANEMSLQLVQAIPNVQIDYLGPNTAGDLAVVYYTYDDSRGSRAATVYNGKLILYGFDFVIGPNEVEYINIGHSIMNSMDPTRPTSNDGGLTATPPNDGDFAATQRVLDNFAEWNRETGERIDREYNDYLEERYTPGTDRYCLSNPRDDKC